MSGYLQVLSIMVFVAFAFGVICYGIYAMYGVVSTALKAVIRKYQE